MRRATFIGAMGALLMATAAAASPLVPAKQTCTTLNCNAVVLPGQINSHLATIANPWVEQFAGQAASCMRFHVTAQSQNLAMSVVAPDGVVFTNDNGGGAPCPTCPRVVVKPAKNGFYTVVVSTTNGAAAKATFTLNVGVYNTTNATNCAAPTTGK